MARARNQRCAGKAAPTGAPLYHAELLEARLLLVTTSWVAQFGGEWNDPANWSAGVPTSADTAVISTFLGETITVPGGDFAVGTLLLTSGTTLRLSGNEDGDATLTIGNAFSNQARIELTNEVVGRSATLSVINGSLINAPGSEITTQVGAGGGSRTIAAQLDNRGTLRINAATTVSKESADHLNSGRIYVISDLTISQSGVTPTFGSSGTIDVAAGRMLEITEGAFTNLNAGTFSDGQFFIAGTLRFPNAGIVTNNSYISISGPLAGIFSSTGINALSSLRTNNNVLGLLDGSDLNITPAGGIFTNNGPVALGIGSTLSVSGAFRQTLSGELLTWLNGTDPATQFGQLRATGSLTIAGGYTVSLADGFDPPMSSNFPILVGSTRSGIFDSGNIDTTPSGRLLTTRYTPSQVVIGVAPLKPSVPDLDKGSDSGVSSTDNITNVITPTFLGTAENDTIVKIFSDNVLVGSAPVFAGAYMVTTQALPDGPHQIQATATDNDGDSSPISAALPVIIDTLLPTVANPLFTFQSRQSVQFQFSENVAPALTPAHLILMNLTTSTQIPSGSIALSYSGPTNVATFTFPGFANGTLPDGDYHATLNPSGIKDTAGNGLANNAPFDFFFLNGDANRDRRVNLQDFNILAANFGQTGRNFTQGNFDYDPAGIVNLDDFNILAGRFGQIVASSLLIFAGKTDTNDRIADQIGFGERDVE